MSSIKIGWIGSGFVGQVGHLNLYEDIKAANVVALSELRPKLGEKVIKKHSIKKLYKNYDLMLENEDLDAIILIVNRNHTAFHAERILKKKFNLFTEKPQASTYSSAKKLVSIAKKNKLTYACGLMRRHDEGIKFAKKKISEFLKNKKLGKIIGADFFCFAGGDYCNIGNYIKTSEPRPLMNLSDKYPSWLNKKYGKNYEEFLNVYIHDLDLIRYVMNTELKVNKVNYNYNKLSYVFFENKDIPIYFKWRKINASQWYEGFSIYFEKGSIEVELNPAFLKNISSTVTINKYGKGGLVNKQEYKNFSFKWCFLNQHLDFIQSIKKESQPISSSFDTIKSMALVDEIFKKIN